MNQLGRLAKLGYNYAAAMGLPWWLFWELSAIAYRDSINERQVVYEAVALAFGSFEKAKADELKRGWEETLNRGMEAEPKPVWSQTDSERMAVWERLFNAKIG